MHRINKDLEVFTELLQKQEIQKRDIISNEISDFIKCYGEESVSDLLKKIENSNAFLQKAALVSEAIKAGFLMGSCSF